MVIHPCNIFEDIPFKHHQSVSLALEFPVLLPTSCVLTALYGIFLHSQWTFCTFATMIFISFKKKFHPNTNTINAYT